MFSERTNGSEMLSISFIATEVIRLLCAYKHDDSMPENADELIKIISDARKALRQIMNTGPQENFFHFYNLKYFNNYDSIKFLKEIVEKMNWESWDADLDQWLANIDQVMEFFKKVQSYSQSRYRYFQGGCF